MKRGLFFSLDAILALLIALSLAAAILNSLAGIPPVSGKAQIPQKISEDALASMEKGGVLQDAVGYSSSMPLRQFSAVLPGNICYRISILRPPAPEPIIAEENCICKEYSVSRRSFLVQSAAPSFYIAEMRSCFK